LLAPRERLHCLHRFRNAHGDGFACMLRRLAAGLRIPAEQQEAAGQCRNQQPECAASRDGSLGAE
jgi:hypothetical protein